MQQIILEPDQVVEINGAILNAEILGEIRQLQTGLDVMELGESLEENYGIKSDTKDYQKLMNFLVSEASNCNKPEEVFLYIEFVLSKMEYSQLFRVPGSNKIKLY